jgi:hypothetical protein
MLRIWNRKLCWKRKGDEVQAEVQQAAPLEAVEELQFDNGVLQQALESAVEENRHLVDSIKASLFTSARSPLPPIFSPAAQSMRRNGRRSSDGDLGLGLGTNMHMYTHMNMNMQVSREGYVTPFRGTDVEDMQPLPQEVLAAQLTDAQLVIEGLTQRLLCLERDNAALEAENVKGTTSNQQLLTQVEALCTEIADMELRHTQHINGTAFEIQHLTRVCQEAQEEANDNQQALQLAHAEIKQLQDENAQLTSSLISVESQRDCLQRENHFSREELQRLEQCGAEQGLLLRSVHQAAQEQHALLQVKESELEESVLHSRANSERLYSLQNQLQHVEQGYEAVTDEIQALHAQLATSTECSERLRISLRTALVSAHESLVQQHVEKQHMAATAEAHAALLVAEKEATTELAHKFAAMASNAVQKLEESAVTETKLKEKVESALTRNLELYTQVQLLSAARTNQDRVIAQLQERNTTLARESSALQSNMLKLSSDADLVQSSMYIIADQLTAAVQEKMLAQAQITFSNEALEEACIQIEQLCNKNCELEGSLATANEARGKLQQAVTDANGEVASLAHQLDVNKSVHADMSELLMQYEALVSEHETFKRTHRQRECEADTTLSELQASVQSLCARNELLSTRAHEADVRLSDAVSKISTDALEHAQHKEQQTQAMQDVVAQLEGAISRATAAETSAHAWETKFHVSETENNNLTSLLDALTSKTEALVASRVILQEENACARKSILQLTLLLRASIRVSKRREKNIAAAHASRQLQVSSQSLRVLTTKQLAAEAALQAMWKHVVPSLEARCTSWEMEVKATLERYHAHQGEVETLRNTIEALTNTLQEAEERAEDAAAARHELCSVKTALEAMEALSIAAGTAMAGHQEDYDEVVKDREILKKTLGEEQDMTAALKQQCSVLKERLLSSIQQTNDLQAAVDARASTSTASSPIRVTPPPLPSTAPVETVSPVVSRHLFSADMNAVIGRLCKEIEVGDEVKRGYQKEIEQAYQKAASLLEKRGSDLHRLVFDLQKKLDVARQANSNITTEFVRLRTERDALAKDNTRLKEKDSSSRKSIQDLEVLVMATNASWNARLTQEEKQRKAAVSKAETLEYELQGATLRLQGADTGETPGGRRGAAPKLSTAASAAKAFVANALKKGSSRHAAGSSSIKATATVPERRLVFSDENAAVAEGDGVTGKVEAKGLSEEFKIVTLQSDNGNMTTAFKVRQ